MTQPPESPSPLPSTPPPPPPAQPPPAQPPHARPPRLYQAAAWVVIASGIVFIAAVLFFSGMALSDHGGWHGRHPHGSCMMHGGKGGQGPMGQGPMGQNPMGHGPDVPMPGPAGPGNGPSESPASPAQPHR